MRTLYTFILQQRLWPLQSHNQPSVAIASSSFLSHLPLLELALTLKASHLSLCAALSASSRASCLSSSLHAVSCCSSRATSSCSTPYSSAWSCPKLSSCTGIIKHNMAKDDEVCCWCRKQQQQQQQPNIQSADRYQHKLFSYTGHIFRHFARGALAIHCGQAAG